MLAQTTLRERLCVALGCLLALAQGVTAPLVAVFTAETIRILTTHVPEMLLASMTPVLVKIGA